MVFHELKKIAKNKVENKNKNGMKNWWFYEK